jgi:hypothetical protein
MVVDADTLDIAHRFGTALANHCLNIDCALRLDATDELTNYYRCNEIPDMSLADYCCRLVRHFDATVHTISLTARLLLRLIPCLQLNDLTVHRIVLAAMRLAQKFSEDRYPNTVFAAAVGGVSNSEMNCLELTAWILLDFDLDGDGQDGSEEASRLWPVLKASLISTPKEATPQPRANAPQPTKQITRAPTMPSPPISRTPNERKSILARPPTRSQIGPNQMRRTSKGPPPSPPKGALRKRKVSRSHLALADSCAGIPSVVPFASRLLYAR